jgi:hypothetical protein
MNKRSVGALTRSSAGFPESVIGSLENSIIQSFSPAMGWRLQAEEVDSSDSAMATEGSAATTVSQTVSFIDNDVGVSVGIPPSVNAVAVVDDTDDLSLGRFLARPTLIHTTTWTTADLTGIKSTLTPWSLFLNNTLIKKKIDNYAFLRGQLHIKVLLNGTPFQYGALRVCSSPLLGWVSDKIRSNPTTNLTSLVPYSQQPGFFVSPQANAGGSITLPFFLHKNWMDITSLTEVQNMGTLNYVIYAPLRVAVTGGTTDVTIRTYAWMTDVQLMGSTNKLTLQGKDEYGVGAVSAPASALASVAGQMSRVPYIGKFARATQIGANAVSGIASLFGYTNVPVIADIHGFQPMNAPMLASAHIGTAVQKLTLDPKQELSIDPSIHGLGSEDELALAHLRGKESYFATTSWSTSDIAGTQLWNSRVNPYLPAQVDINNAGAIPVGKRVYHIPLSYVGAMFKHWRGDLIFRIKVVGTKFHKGRLKISYDPIADITTSDPGENAVYTEILDIGESDDVEIRIPYHQATAWCRLDQTIQDNWTPGNPLAPRLGVDNGVITIRVLNVLTAPSSSVLNLLFFVKGGDNFEYANPAGHIGPDVINVVPSFFALQGVDTVDLLPTRLAMGTPASILPERYEQNFGECVGSLRNILHRSMISDTTSLNTITASSAVPVMKVYKRMPFTPGFQTGGFLTSANNVVAAAGSNPYAFNTMAHVPYVSGMFLGYRGSVNYHITPSSDLQGSLSDIRAIRVTSSASITANARTFTNLSGFTFGGTLSGRTRNVNVVNYLEDGLAGMAITSTQTNNTVSFNFPDYNHFNFSLVDPLFYNIGSSSDGTNEQAVLLKILFRAGVVVNTEGSFIQSEISAGPDFGCHYFLCCPTLDFAISIPSAV